MPIGISEESTGKFPEKTQTGIPHITLGGTYKNPVAPSVKIPEETHEIV